MTEGNSAMTGSALRICVGVATIGRAAILHHILMAIANQTRAPDHIVVCHASPEDILKADTQLSHGTIKLEFITSPPGLPKQRNVILDLLAEFDLVFFMDDDFVMAPRYLEAVEAFFSTNPTMVAATGMLIADGVKGPGLSIEAGHKLIQDDQDAGHSALDLAWQLAPHAYGCNMALRLATIRAHTLRFDERLPMYGWSEDIDFSHRIARHGGIGKLAGARGVHLGTKQGRSSGRRLGYSQVANPIYLLGKGSYSLGRAGRSVARNLAANALHALWPEPFIDRRGRLLGNALAFLDLCRGRMRPERMLDI